MQINISLQVLKKYGFHMLRNSRRAVTITGGTDKTRIPFATVCFALVNSFASPEKQCHCAGSGVASNRGTYMVNFHFAVQM